MPDRFRRWTRGAEPDSLGDDRRMPTYAIRSHKLFISHSYHFRDEYIALVALLDRAAQRDPSWRWENLSVDRDAPLLSVKDAKYADVYTEAMPERMALANAILLILRRQAVDSEWVFTEAYEATPRRRPSVPVIGVLPRNEPVQEWNQDWGNATVEWDAVSIIAAVRRLSTAASINELQLTPCEAQRRAAIVAALDENGWQISVTARALGIGRTTLWKAMRSYMIQGGR